MTKTVVEDTVVLTRLTAGQARSGAAMISDVPHTLWDAAVGLELLIGGIEGGCIDREDAGICAILRNLAEVLRSRADKADRLFQDIASALRESTHIEDGTA